MHSLMDIRLKLKVEISKSVMVRAVTEITSPEDIEAVALCAHCGTAVLAAAHATGPSDLRRRPLYRRLLSLGVFERLLTIEQKDGKRSYRMEKTEGTTC